jgi:hypothetical protein
MLAEMSAAQYAEWMAYDSLEPLGWRGNMYANAVTAATVANVNRKKGSKAVTPADFMPKEETGGQKTTDIFGTLKKRLRPKRANGNRPESTRKTTA